jgi:hypothetical protein
MRFSILDEYVDFLSKHKCIEFEELLSEDEANRFNQAIERVLLKELKKKSLDQATNADLWKAGRFLWKKDAEIKKMLLKSRIGEIASFLFKKRPIRLGYDQAFFTTGGRDVPLPDLVNLKEISCIEPVLGGAIFNLSDHSFETAQPDLPDMRKQKKGNVIFFTPDYPIPFSDLFQISHLRCLVVCFTLNRVRYKLEPKDLHTHDLKKEGYVFGDLLKEETHPFLYH